VTHQVPAKPQSRYLTMPDGVRIAIDIYVPNGPQPHDGFPTILHLTPYYRRFALKDGASSDVEASPNAAAARDMFVPRGYAMVVVDVRGSGASFGARDSFRSPSEREDYRAIIDWIVDQEWSDGNIGATGISYVGAASDFAASTGHPAIKAIAPISAVWDTYKEQFYPGGILLTHLTSGYGEIMEALDWDDRELLKKFSYFANPDLAGPAPVDEDTDGSLVREAIHGHFANVHMPDFMREFQFRDNHLAHDPSFTTDSFSPHAYSSGIRDEVAIMAISGWMDGGYCNGSISRFLSMNRNANRYLLIGPWDHGARVNVSPFRSQPLPEFPLHGAILRFFDEHVCGEDTGLSSESPVHVHVMRSECWHAASNWPVTEKLHSLHLAADGELSSLPGAAEQLSYQVDYACGTGQNTRYGRLQVRNVQEYYPDWQSTEAGRLRFSADPLEQDLTVAGHPLLTLHLTSDQQDACVFVYLEDIEPDGTVRYVSEGMLRALHRETAPPSPTYSVSWPNRDFTRQSAKALVPGESVEFTFALLPTAWSFPKGHRIALSIAGADRDNFALWPYGRPGKWLLELGGENASRLELPIL
ncbi:MAG: CocE/NonD family hydrolase, partial [Hyphomicrobiaceae bacterium]